MKNPCEYHGRKFDGIKRNIQQNGTQKGTEFLPETTKYGYKLMAENRSRKRKPGQPWMDTVLEEVTGYLSRNGGCGEYIYI